MLQGYFVQIYSFSISASLQGASAGFEGLLENKLLYERVKLL